MSMNLEYALGPKHALDMTGAAEIKAQVDANLKAAVQVNGAQDQLTSSPEIAHTENTVSSDAEQLARVRTELQALTPTELRQVKQDAGIKPNRVW
jgi:hypothetical protein